MTRENNVTWQHSSQIPSNIEIALITAAITQINLGYQTYIRAITFQIYLAYSILRQLLPRYNCYIICQAVCYPDIPGTLYIKPGITQIYLEYDISGRLLPRYTRYGI